MASEPNYHTTRFFTKKLLSTEMKKTEIVINKPVCLGLSILELRKIFMYEFLNDYVKPKYVVKAKLRYMDIDSFFVYTKKQRIFTKTLHKMLKLDLILQIMN